MLTRTQKIKVLKAIIEKYERIPDEKFEIIPSLGLYGICDEIWIRTGRIFDPNIIIPELKLFFPTPMHGTAVYWWSRRNKSSRLIALGFMLAMVEGEKEK